MKYPVPPTIRIRSGIVALKRAMQAYFTAYDVQAKVLIGLKARDLWTEPRVIIIPGLFDGSATAKPMDAGAFGPPQKKESYNPRELSEWTRQMTFSIFAVDSNNLTDEEAQIEAQEALTEWTIRAAWNAIDPQSGLNVGGPGIEWGKATLIHPPVQFAYGKELLFQFTYRHPMYDVPQSQQRVTFALQKGPLLNTAQSGQNAYVITKSGSSVSISGLGFANRGMIGQFMTLSGCASSGNNGVFEVIGLNSAQSLIISNASAVVPDANNGSIVWSVGPAT